MSIELTKTVVSKSCGDIERRYTVSGFPVTFHEFYFHPFERYAMVHELEELQKDQYRVLTGDDITTPYARERIAQFFAKLEEYTAEAERIKALSPEEYEAECTAGRHRHLWVGGYFRTTDDTEEA